MMKKHKVVVFDLDDTLYKEMDYLKSAYHEIADYVEKESSNYDVYDKMIAWWEAGENVFGNLISSCHLDVTVNDLLDIYRKHQPQICLDETTRSIINQLLQTCQLGIISDGRSVSQRNKIKAMGLDFIFDDILISEETGYSKPSEEPYRYFMKKYPQSKYVYVGDNPVKDFLAPNKLGWMTVCLLDNGQNIHLQDFTLSVEYLPQHKINDISELIDLLA